MSTAKANSNGEQRSAEVEPTSRLQSQVHVPREDSWYDVYLDDLRLRRLAAPLELLASWLVVLGVFWYYGYVYFVLSRRKNKNNNNTGPGAERRLPLMTEAKGRNLEHPKSAKDLYQEIRESLDEVENLEGSISSQQLLEHLRANSKLRRTVSRFMLSQGCEAFELYGKLDEIWQDLLALPTVEQEDEMGVFIYELSLIIPAYREHGARVVATIHRALRTCRCPSVVQIVVVDAGECAGLRESIENEMPLWKEDCAEVKVVHYSGGGGRGPTLNFGALCSNGRVLTFLHSDCLLPWYWDSKVLKSLQPNKAGKFEAHAAAFRLGVDLSKTGFLKDEPYPWGIRAVRFMVNFRSWIFRMPYGDQAISMRSSAFRYLGGFPNQPMMEDYDMMNFLRMRARVSKNERLVMLWGSCNCSVRRWQKVGVVYMTLANATLVHRYTLEGWNPEDVFDYYYRRPFKKHE